MSRSASAISLDWSNRESIAGFLGLGGVHASDKASNSEQSGWIRECYQKLHHPRQRAVNHALQATRD
jgi:hypothetical protein